MKEFLSIAAVALTFAMFWPYILATRSGRIRPHVFSWLIWTLVTVSVFFAQVAGGAGVGALAIGISGVITGYVALLAWRRRADLEITRVDWAFLAAAVSALPVWWLTSDPLWAVIILTGVDLSGFGPTFRKAWQRPHHEHIGFFAIGAARNVLVISALETVSITTALFPAAVGAGCMLLVVLLHVRRRMVRASEESVPEGTRST